MAMGPVQLVVLGFGSRDFHGEVIEEFRRLPTSDSVRVIDTLVVSKDAQGKVRVLSESSLTDDEGALGGYVAALLGLEQDDLGGSDGDARGGLDVRFDEDLGEVIEEIPADTAAAVIMLDHQWAVPLHDAVRSAGGFLVTERFISPLDLVEIGLLVEPEAAQAG